MPPLIIAGVGISMAIPAVASAALGAVPPAEMGTASGASNTMQRFGGAFGVAVVTAVFTAHGSLASAAGVVAGYRPALTVSALPSLADATAAVAVGRRGSDAPPAATLAKRTERAERRDAAPAATVVSLGARVDGALTAADPPRRSVAVLVDNSASAVDLEFHADC